MDFSRNGDSEFPNAPRANEREERLLEQRTLVIQEALTDELVVRTNEQLVLLTAESEAPVKVLLGLWGRKAPQGLALHDAFLSVPVRAVATGRVSGMGVVAFCGAEKRFALPSARFRLAEPTGAAHGPSLAADAKESADERERVIALLAQATRQPAERVERDMEQGAAFTAEEAADYGLVRRVVQSADEVGE